MFIFLSLRFSGLIIRFTCFHLDQPPNVFHAAISIFSCKVFLKISSLKKYIQKYIYVYIQHTFKDMVQSINTVNLKSFTFKKKAEMKYIMSNLRMEELSRNSPAFHNSVVTFPAAGSWCPFLQRTTVSNCTLSICQTTTGKEGGSYHKLRVLY